MKMNNIDVLLINLPIDSLQSKNLRKKVNSFPPLGLLYIATVLKEHKVKVVVKDLAVTSISQKYFFDEIERLSPKIIGFSTYNESWKAQKYISKLIRNKFPEIIIVAGGAFASFCYKDMFEEKIVDYVIRGEGEFAFYKLYKNLFLTNRSINDIPGLVYLNSSNEIVSNMPNRIKNLDELPFPDLDLVDITNYTIGIALITARGCPGDCIFCSSRAFFGKAIRLRSAKNIFDEIISLYSKYNTPIFYFTDDTFTINKRRVYDLCELIMSSNIDFIWGCESRADVLNDEVFVSTLANAGCRKMQIGLESADNKVLSLLKKHIKIEQIEEAIKLTTKYGISVQVSYIIGHVFDTKETISKTIEYVKYLERKYGVLGTVSINTPFPGTEQYNNADILGLKIYARNWDEYKFDNPIISTRHLTINDIRNYFNKTINTQ